jgi:hypothetical protein
MVAMTAARLAARLGGTLAALLAACDPAPPPDHPAPEPAAALRPPELRGEVPEDARVTDYVLDARLDTDTHEVTGTARITFRNRSARPVDRLPLHLYMNAFRAEDTAWMLEARGSHRGQRQSGKGDRWGYIDLKSVKLLGRGRAADFRDLEGERGAATELAWKEGDDPSLASVTLPAAVGPDEAVVVELEFVTRLPEVFARTGYAGDFHMLGQWYPKLGVLEQGGTWRAHVFTLNSEFYADFGDYEVHLDVPADMVVGATGILVAADPPEAGRKRLHYRAEMVHDFAWAADPAFREYGAMWKDVRIRQLVHAEHAADVPAHLAALVATLESMEARFGPYPWSTVTVIHPPEDAGGAQGMEYPTLFTTSEILPGSPWLRLAGFSERLSGTLTTIHEFGHQYFQGLLASDEWRQPWLDEGMNTAANALALEDWLGPSPWMATLGNQRVTLDDFVRSSLDGEANLDPVDADADTYRAVTSNYGDIVYRKTGALVHTLRRLVGPDRFDPALRKYTLAHRFRHPTGDDLVRTLVAELGPTALLQGTGPEGQPVRLDVADFLDQALHTVHAVDFSLEVVRNRRRAGDAGYHRDEHGALVLRAAADDAETAVRDLPDAEVEAVVVTRRNGEFRVPVVLEVEFADGARERVRWDGQPRYRVWTWPGRRVRAAHLDPDGELLLEARRLDNHRAAPDAGRDDGLSGPVGDLAEELALATLGGLAL